MKASFIKFTLVVTLFVGAVKINAQPNFGQSGGPFVDPSSSGSGGSITAADSSANGSSFGPPTDPGGPVDPPNDIVPIDSEVYILLAAAVILGGFQFYKRRQLALQKA